MATLSQFKKLLSNQNDISDSLPLFEIIEDVFHREESIALLLHNKNTMDDIDLDAYEKILFESYQKKESLANEYANQPRYLKSEYERKIERADRASNNYFAFSSALNSLNNQLKKLNDK